MWWWCLLWYEKFAKIEANNNIIQNSKNPQKNHIVITKINTKKIKQNLSLDGHQTRACSLRYRKNDREPSRFAARVCVYVGEEQALKKLGQYGREVEYYRVQYLSVMCKEPVVVHGRYFFGSRICIKT